MNVDVDEVAADAEDDSMSNFMEWSPWEKYKRSKMSMDLFYGYFDDPYAELQKLTKDFQPFPGFYFFFKAQSRRLEYVLQMDTGLVISRPTGLPTPLPTPPLDPSVVTPITRFQYQTLHWFECMEQVLLETFLQTPRSMEIFNMHSVLHPIPLEVMFACKMVTQQCLISCASTIFLSHTLYALPVICVKKTDANANANASDSSSVMKKKKKKKRKLLAQQEEETC